MGLWDINNVSADLIKTVAKSSGNSGNFAVSNSAGFSSDYAKILAQKISQLEQDVQAASENVSTQDQELSADTNLEVIETVKRFRPDGSIMITTYKDGKIDSTTKIKPHLVAVPDYNAPPTPQGDPEIKMVRQLSLAELLML
jgi:hypothetical protein